MHDILRDISSLLHASIDSSPERVAAFFKTGPGAYAAFDRFLGITTPTLRKIAKSFLALPLITIEQLLLSPFNEERLLALIILVLQYQRAALPEKSIIYRFYLKNLHCVNNWNLVDNSAHLILGAHLWHKDCRILINLAKSQNLWKRRISVVATWYFIKRQDFACTMQIATILLDDKQDLIHKASGWMLREVGKQDPSMLSRFLNQNGPRMPRTMLRYAIERLPAHERRHYMLKQ